MLMAPSEPSQPPGGRHEGVALEMRVANLGSGRRPVARAPAPGAVGARTPFSKHGPSGMFFTIFYNGSTGAPELRLNVALPMGSVVFAIHVYCVRS